MKSTVGQRGHPLIHENHLQSSDRKLRTMYNRVHVLIASPMMANGKKIQFTTRKGVLLCGGSTKLDVTPAGGGIAGVMSEAIALNHPVWNPGNDRYLRNMTQEKGSGQPRDVKSNQKMRACQGLRAHNTSRQYGVECTMIVLCVESGSTLQTSHSTIRPCEPEPVHLSGSPL